MKNLSDAAEAEKRSSRLRLNDGLGGKKGATLEDAERVKTSEGYSPGSAQFDKLGGPVACGAPG